MSLKGGSVMLGFDDQSEPQTGDEPGRHPDFSASQRGCAFRRREKRGGLRVGGYVLGRAKLGRVGTDSAWFGAAVYGEYERVESGADHTPDHPVWAEWRGARPAQPAASLPHRVHAGRQLKRISILFPQEQRLLSEWLDDHLQEEDGDAGLLLL